MSTRGLGIRTSAPIPAIVVSTRIGTDQPTLQRVKLVGARRNGARHDAADWHVASSPEGHTRPVHGALYEPVDDVTLAEVEQELRDVARERAEMLQRLTQRRERALARLTPIPNVRATEIEAYVTARQ